MTPAPPRAADTPARALDLLREGNARFVEGRGHTGSLSRRRLELTEGQNPFATVLGCSDSRVPLETIFDQIPGQLFVVRVAGNFLSDDVVGTIEFGVAVLRAPEILIVGHGSCGAVGAALDYVRDGVTPSGYIRHIVRAVEPAVVATRNEPGLWLDNAIARNVRDNVAALTQRSAIVAAAVAAGEVAVTGAVYDLPTGRVNFL